MQACRFFKWMNFKCIFFRMDELKRHVGMFLPRVLLFLSCKKIQILANPPPKIKPRHLIHTVRIRLVKWLNCVRFWETSFRQNWNKMVQFSYSIWIPDHFAQLSTFGISSLVFGQTIQNFRLICTSSVCNGKFRFVSRTFSVPTSALHFFG